MVLVKVNIAPSPTVDIPVIVLSTVIVPIPIAITVVPAATVEFPQVTVTTCLLYTSPSPRDCQ